MIDDHTTMFTALSVALEAMVGIIDSSPQRMELGYARAATLDAKKELDAYMETKDPAHLQRGNEIIQRANAQMSRWGHHV